MKTSFGISAALTTPFDEALCIDHARLIAHGERLLAAGCDAITLFGTTGEGPSLSQGEKADVLSRFLAHGIDPARMIVGVGSPSLDDAVGQALAALRGGVQRLLVMPPFYFNDVTEDGIFAWYANFLERTGDYAPQVIFYHIPQVTGVSLTPLLLRRLRAGFGAMALGVKDSSGDWATTTGFLAEKEQMVLVGDERHLGPAVALGAAGAISGMANIFPRELGAVVRNARGNPALDTLVDALVRHPVIPAIKALFGAVIGEDGWQRMRPPLLATPAAVTAELAALAQAVE